MRGGARAGGQDAAPDRTPRAALPPQRRCDRRWGWPRQGEVDPPERATCVSSSHGSRAAQSTTPSRRFAAPWPLGSASSSRWCRWGCARRMKRWSACIVSSARCRATSSHWACAVAPTTSWRVWRCAARPVARHSGRRSDGRGAPGRSGSFGSQRLHEAARRGGKGGLGDGLQEARDVHLGGRERSQPLCGGLGTDRQKRRRPLGLKGPAAAARGRRRAQGGVGQGAPRRRERALTAGTHSGLRPRVGVARHSGEAWRGLNASPPRRSFVHGNSHATSDRAQRRDARGNFCRGNPARHGSGAPRRSWPGRQARTARCCVEPRAERGHRGPGQGHQSGGASGACRRRRGESGDRADGGR
ncbi:hypothetical protein Bpfe_031098 [Biomphalaria pfeifferi]|uniref:Uncharacterized protein n=1 Tax=Biomphalaria pfeifferi TaxID=112525 RepID=A0AAD8ANI0_BIOPF|nr:hypothetical protein Bpfe_031098 [Biomphalaria pfeifferi]